MPTPVACPNCSARFTLRKPVAARRSVTCPKCRVPFAPGVGAEDDLPDAILEDDDDRPRARRGGDDDRPRPRRSANERSHDRRPPHRDDDRAPRRRAGADDRPRRARGRKRGIPLAVILPVAALGLLVMAGGVYFLFFRGGSGSVFGGGNTPQADMVAWAPEDTTSCVYLDYAALSQHPVVDQDRTWGLGAVPRHGLEPREVRAVFHAGWTSHGVTVIRTSSPLDQAAMDRVARNASATPATANGKSFLRTPSGGALYRAGDHLLVVADQEATVTRRLGKNEDRVVVSSELRDYLGRATGDLWTVSVAGRGSITRNGEGIEGSVTSIRLVGDFIERTDESTLVNSGSVDRIVGQLRNQPDAQVSASGRRIKVTRKWRPPDFDRLRLTEFTMGHW